MHIAPLPTRKHFRREHVIVKYPGHAGKIQILRPPLPPKASMPAVAGGFQPTRLVINLKIVLTALPNSLTFTFVPPIEVRVRYDSKDLASTYGKIQMGYWDKTKWVRFTPAAHGFHLEWNANKGQGWVVVSLTTWSDPPIAIGT